MYWLQLISSIFISENDDVAFCSISCHGNVIPRFIECEENHHNGQSALNDIQSNQFTKLVKFFIRIRTHFLPTPSYLHGLINFSNTTVSNLLYTTTPMHCEPTWRQLNIKISISAWCGQQLITKQVRGIWMYRFPNKYYRTFFTLMIPSKAPVHKVHC